MIKALDMNPFRVAAPRADFDFPAAQCRHRIDDQGPDILSDIEDDRLRMDPVDVFLGHFLGLLALRVEGARRLGAGTLRAPRDYCFQLGLSKPEYGTPR